MGNTQHINLAHAARRLGWSDDETEKLARLGILRRRLDRDGTWVVPVTDLVLLATVEDAAQILGCRPDPLRLKLWASAVRVAQRSRDDPMVFIGHQWLVLSGPNRSLADALADGRTGIVARPSAVGERVRTIVDSTEAN